jgi:DNA-binding FadR family transcriptional regulator
MAVETEAASLAALRRSQDDLRTMRAAFRMMKHDSGAAEMDARIDADLAFHQAICNATRNEHFQTLFAGMSSIIRKNIAVSRRNSAAHRNFGSEAQAEHEAILGAIVDRDRDAAREAARRHIENTAHRLDLARE